MDLFAGQEYMQTQRMDMQTQWGEGEGRTHWKNTTDIDTLPCIKERASGKLPYSTGASAWCSVMTQRAGRGGEGRFKGREYMYTYRADALCCMAETNTTL